MRATADDVLTALELIASRVPDRHVQPDQAMALSWLESLSRYDHTAIFRAAREWGGQRFPATGEFVIQVQEAARAIAVEEAAKYSSGELTTSECREGCDDGWVWTEEVNDAGRFFIVRPCARCQPVGYAIWAHRARPDHNPDRCPDCVAIRRNKDPLPGWLLEAREDAARQHRPVQTF